MSPETMSQVPSLEPAALIGDVSSWITVDANTALAGLRGRFRMVDRLEPVQRRLVEKKAQQSIHPGPRLIESVWIDQYSIWKCRNDHNTLTKTVTTFRQQSAEWIPSALLD